MPMILAQPPRYAVPTAPVVHAVHLAAPPAACVPPFYVCSQPWSEHSFWAETMSNLPQQARGAIPAQTTVHVEFLPGENHQIVDLPIQIPVGKRLFLQDIHLLPNLPERQHASISVGCKLHMDASGHAQVGLYADPGTKIKAELERDSSLGSGQVTLVVEGSYVDLHSH